MAESKDSAIKLFGKTIPLSTLNQEIVSADGPPSALADSVQSATVSGTAVVGGYGDHSLECSMHEESSRGPLRNGQDGDQDKETAGKELMEDEQEDDISHQRIEDLKEPETSSGISENPKTLSGDREISSPKSSNNGEQSETSSSQEKTLKKPDKILPCPRCNSMDTKFCYYNNYNVNQPRHFCKNCQRYWTAGGTMRNVPVGAGRRKNKSSSASHYRHIMVSEALRASQVNSTNGIHNTSLGNNGTVLRFGSDSPLCESVASVLKLSERTQNSARNGFHTPEQRILLSSGAADIRDERTSGSHFTTSNLSEKGGNAGLPDTAFKNYQGLPPPVPCFPGPPWPYLWNSAMPPPTFCPSGFPVSFYPAPTYWSCTVPAPWNVPYFSSLSSSPNQSTQSPSPTSPTLGKHSREGNILSPSTTEKEETSEDINTSERSVLVPKILRIDDPSEAAKSSIWATLGIKTEKTNSINEGSLFNGFQSRADDRNYMAETSAVLQANPAALSRSLKFHESA